MQLPCRISLTKCPPILNVVLSLAQRRSKLPLLRSITIWCQATSIEHVEIHGHCQLRYPSFVIVFVIIFVFSNVLARGSTSRGMCEIINSIRNPMQDMIFASGDKPNQSAEAGYLIYITHKTILSNRWLPIGRRRRDLWDKGTPPRPISISRKWQQRKAVNQQIVSHARTFIPSYYDTLSPHPPPGRASASARILWAMNVCGWPWQLRRTGIDADAKF
jgi:hypothetical protein